MVKKKPDNYEGAYIDDFASAWPFDLAPNLPLEPDTFAYNITLAQAKERKKLEQEFVLLMLMDKDKEKTIENLSKYRKS